MYSNTNYLLPGKLSEKVTGLPAERCIALDVIEPAGLRDTGLAVGAYIEAPHCGSTRPGSA